MNMWMIINNTNSNTNSNIYLQKVGQGTVVCSKSPLSSQGY